jgi:osmotically-inducible protein OsmY
MDTSTPLGRDVDLSKQAKALANQHRSTRALIGPARRRRSLRAGPLLPSEAVGAAHRADAETEAAALEALLLDALPAYGIDVDVDVGRVTLCGVVDVGSQREAAERIARRVCGVSEVRNRLKVWIAVSAEEVAERVRDAIGVDAIVGADGIRVTVRDNVVTLSGSVRSGEDRDAAVAVAARTSGVVGVGDEVRVVA